MIDGETGERTIQTLVKTQDEVRENTGGLMSYTLQYVRGLQTARTLNLLCAIFLSPCFCCPAACSEVMLRICFLRC